MENINSTLDYRAIVAELGEAVIDRVNGELADLHTFTARYDLTEEVVANSQYCTLTKYYGDILLHSDNADHALNEGLVDLKGHTTASLLGELAFWALLVDVNDWLRSIIIADVPK